MNPAFFTLHADLPREGPGCADDVAWAAAVAGTPDRARICDAGAGPGADIATWRDVRPGASLTAVERHAPFAEDIRTRFRDVAEVTVIAGDMNDIGGTIAGPFDLIWSAGALYFLGIETALQTWRAALAPDGAIAFTEPCFFTDTPSEAAREFWEGYQTGTVSEISDAIRASGYRVLDQRPVSDAGWEAYFAPLAARIAMLRPGADADLAAVLDEAEIEIRTWRACRHETGYLLSVVRPE